MINFKIVVFLGILASVRAQPMWRGQSQDDWRRHQTGQQSRVPSVSSSQQPAESFSFFFYHQPTDYLPESRRTLPAPPPPFDPRFSDYDYQVPNVWEQLPDAQWYGVPHGQTFSHQNYEALFNQFDHMTMTGQPTFAYTDHRPIQMGHGTGDEAASSQGQSLSQGEIDRPTFAQQQLISDELKQEAQTVVKALVEHFKQLWTQQVSHPEQLSPQALADQVVRIEVMLDLIRVPLVALEKEILPNMQRNDEAAFYRRLHLVRHLYNVAHSSRSQEHHIYYDQEAQEEREEDFNQVLHLLHRAATDDNDREASEKVYDAIAHMRNRTYRAGELFIQYLKSKSRWTDLNCVGKTPLKRDACEFAITFNLSTDSSSDEQFFSGRADLLRCLNQYLRETVRKWRGNAEVGVDNFSYVFDVSLRNSQ